MEKTKTYNQLLAQRPTPFYVFDSRSFVSNYRKLEASMRKVYPNYHVAYSYKTNYTPYICGLVKNLGGYAEVVSDMELTLAKKLGYNNPNIIYNGPEKGILLEGHLLEGGIVNIDNISEATRISEFVSQHTDKTFKVGLRINMKLDNAFISRFGMTPFGEEIDNAVRILRQQPNIKIVGLHCHISRHRGLEAWAQRAEIMINAADKYIDGIPEYISLGSGMFADMDDRLKEQFGTSVPDYDDYARVTMTPFLRRYGTLSIEKQPIVFTEPGTTVVARYIDFITTVRNIKTIDSRTIAIVDGSYENIGEICGLKKLPVTNLGGSKSSESFDNIDITGYTCLEQDVLVGGYSGNLGKNDRIVIENVGAYSIVSKPQFIHPNCPMYAIDENGNIIEIMRAETFDDIFSKFYFI